MLKVIIFLLSFQTIALAKSDCSLLFRPYDGDLAGGMYSYSKKVVLGEFIGITTANHQAVHVPLKNWNSDAPVWGEVFSSSNSWAALASFEVSLYPLKADDAPLSEYVIVNTIDGKAVYHKEYVLKRFKVQIDDREHEVVFYVRGEKLDREYSNSKTQLLVNGFGIDVLTSNGTEIQIRDSFVLPRITREKYEISHHWKSELIRVDEVSKIELVFSSWESWSFSGQHHYKNIIIDLISGKVDSREAYRTKDTNFNPYHNSLLEYGYKKYTVNPLLRYY